MRRVRKQCVAQRSTEAIAQPAARRPEAQQGTRPKKCFDTYVRHSILQSSFRRIFAAKFGW
ncbi:MAG: hypothetical protein NZ455_08480 [Bacteroidia bacterium]|nr:hypothetical protein [Bacteroidia bacterium]MDW8345801.1 hypothetical protein [Bacteroidia bacterium]